MDAGAWCYSDDGNHCLWQCYSGRDQYNRLVSHKLPANRSRKAPIWRLIWRKIKKEKKRIVDCSNSSSMRFSYDPYSYSQNFDQGSVFVDADDLSRSFSARFAVPSRTFTDDELIEDDRE